MISNNQCFIPREKAYKNLFILVKIIVCYLDHEINRLNQSTTIIQQAIINKIFVKEFDQHKTSQLKQTCSKHSKEIIMFNVNVDKSDQQTSAVQNVLTKIILAQKKQKKENLQFIINEIKQLKDYYNNSLSESIDENKIGLIIYFYQNVKCKSDSIIKHDLLYKIIKRS
ncbi:unnamed protein product [Paramecium sonneborni]|uniref:Uncharacterized protein n=1 Tax=Paramecium sonneborni TaxID=65129 RepID=A0A8S1RPV0_9CILI|nr:unnamed protein product [Paramecium sonneborni]